MPLLLADLPSAERAILRWRSSDELDDGVTYRWHAWLRRWTVDSFFPSQLGEATMLEEGVSDHGHECMTMEPLSRSSFEVIEPEFLLQLLMGLFANPSCLRGS